MGLKISQIVDQLDRGETVYRVTIELIEPLYLLERHPLFDDYYLFLSKNRPHKILSLFILDPKYDDFPNYCLNEKAAKDFQIILISEYLQNKKDSFEKEKRL